MFMFYGANRTGRFSGRLIQLQNLPQNHMEDLEQARERSNARMIVIDPRYTDTAAGREDEWIPIRPGTDARWWPVSPGC